MALSVGSGVLDRKTYVDLRGEVEDDLGAHRGEDLGDGGRVSDVDLGSVAPAAIACSRFARLPLERLSITVTRSPRASQRVDEIRADEAGAAGHDAVHGAAGA